MDTGLNDLLEGLSDDERAARRRLVEDLEGQGFTAAEIRGAAEDDRLVLLGLERLLGARHTAREVSEESGVPVELLLRIRRLGGLPRPEPDEVAFDDEDVTVARATKLFLDAGLSEAAISELTRVMGEAMARIAGAVGGTFVGAFLQPGDAEDELARRFQALANELTPALEPVVLAAFKAHLREAIRGGMIGRTERQAGRIGALDTLSVCFADVVGFTRLGGMVDVEELGHVAGTLAELAAEVARPPVRLVKTIGDAAMFVSSESAPLVGVALDLLEAIDATDLPPLRAGVANGPALARSGDVYGPSVNLASRVTGAARPGSVLCTQEVHDAAAEDFAWSFAGKYRLKGISGAPPLHRARPRTPEPEPPA